MTEQEVQILGWFVGTNTGFTIVTYALVAAIWTKVKNK